MNITLSDIGAVASLGAALVFYYKSKKAKELKPPSTTQELINYKDISPDGIVELPNHQYRIVIEVEPVNMMLKSAGEQEAIWVGFRDLINSLTLPVTFLVQTRHLDLRDYLNELQLTIVKASTPELQAYGKDLCQSLQDKTENNVRDRRHYIILKIDAQSVASIDSGIRIENDAINALMSDILPKKGNMSDKELRAFARQELENMSGVIQGCLNGMEIPSMRLNKLGVLDMIYATLNRDVSPHARLIDAHTQEMFSLVTQSLTPFVGGDNIAKSTGHAQVEDPGEKITENRSA